MPHQFTKMHGAGNDYVYVDCFAQPVPGQIAELARTISDRHRGVGADGLILICPSDQADAMVHHASPQIETDAHFPSRTNVEFVELLGPHEVRQRTWERGSGETQACGTGASAVCLAGVLTGRTERQLTGGDLQLEWNDTDNHVTMTGPAVEVFSGQWRIK
jgi:diaminopimelate epimerase